MDLSPNNKISAESLLHGLMTGKLTIEEVDNLSNQLSYEDYIGFSRGLQIFIFVAGKINKDLSKNE